MSLQWKYYQHGVRLCLCSGNTISMESVYVSAVEILSAWSEKLCVSPTARKYYRQWLDGNLCQSYRKEIQYTNKLRLQSV